VAKNHRKVSKDNSLENEQIVLEQSPVTATIQPVVKEIKKEKSKMGRTKKVDDGSKTVYVKFSLPEDIELYERLSEDAKSKRYDLATYITLVLLEAYPAPVMEEVNQ